MVVDIAGVECDGYLNSAAFFPLSSFLLTLKGSEGST